MKEKHGANQRVKVIGLRIIDIAFSRLLFPMKMKRYISRWCGDSMAFNGKVKNREHLLFPYESKLSDWTQMSFYYWAEENIKGEWCWNTFYGRNGFVLFKEESDAILTKLTWCE